MIEYLANYLAEIARDVSFDLNVIRPLPPMVGTSCTLEITPHTPWTPGKGYGYEATFTYQTSGVVSAKGMGR